VTHNSGHRSSGNTFRAINRLFGGCILTCNIVTGGAIPRPMRRPAEGSRPAAPEAPDRAITGPPEALGERMASQNKEILSSKTQITAVQIGDILRNTVKEKLARDEVVASMTVRLVRQVEIAQIAKTAGFDTIYVDMEHCSASFETTSQICMAALAAGIAPFVRVPANTPEYITRVLEGGALGVIAPHIGSAAEA